jgi:hypothetical protein
MGIYIYIYIYIYYGNHIPYLTDKWFYRDEGDGGTYMTLAFFIFVSSIRASGVTGTNITFYP